MKPESPNHYHTANHDHATPMPVAAAAPARGRSMPWWLFLVATLVQIAAANPYINLYDEGIILVGAEQVLRGQVPYRDFWTMYGPAQFYLASWLFSVFGPTDVAVRAIGLLAKSAITALCYIATARLAPKLVAVAASLVVLGVLIALQQVVVLGLLITLQQDAFPVFPAVALALAALLFVERGLRSGPRWLIAAGLSTGLAACFRHDLGAYNAMAIGLGILLMQCARHRDGRALRETVVLIGWYALGIALVMAPVVGALLYAVPLADLYENLIHIPSSIYPANRALPFPGATELALALQNSPIRNPSLIVAFAVYAPFIVCLWVLTVEISALFTGRPAPSLQRLIEDGSALTLLLALTCLLFIAKGLVRVSTVHMAQSLVLAVVLIAIEVARRQPREHIPRRWAWIGLSLPAALLILLGIAGAVITARNIPTWFDEEKSLAGYCREPVLPRLRCVTIDRDYLAAARLVRELSRPDDPIYVGAGRHDKIFVNGVAFYFAAGRQPVTRWYELHPGIQTQARIQLDMVNTMTATPPRLIVLDRRWDGMAEPNASRHSSGERRLDDYIAQNYVEVQRFGSVSVLAPRAAPAATDIAR